MHAPAAELAGFQRSRSLLTSPAYSGLLPLQHWATLNRKDALFISTQEFPKLGAEFEEPRAALYLVFKLTSMRGGF